jgi:hypothetical protein
MTSTNTEDVIPNDNWPNGTSCDAEARRKLLEWARHKGLRYSNRGHCLPWLAKGRCTHPGYCDVAHRGGDWLDHITAWTRNGKPALLLSQPYGPLNNGHLQEILARAAEFGLAVKIHGDGWYGCGTTAIEFWQREQLASLEADNHARVLLRVARESEKLKL